MRNKVLNKTLLEKQDVPINLTTPQILKRLSDCYLPLPLIQNTSSLISTVEDFRTSKPLVGVVQGPTELGKTTSIKAALDTDKFTSLLINANSSSCGDLAELILKAAEAPIFRHRSPQRLAVYVAAQLKLRGVTILVIDNAEQLLTKGGLGKGILALTSQVVGELNCGLIFVGRVAAIRIAEEVSYSIGADTKVVGASALPFRKNEDIDIMRAVLILFLEHANKCLNETINLDILKSPSLARRMLIASKGRIGPITKILIGAIYECLQNGLLELTRDELAESWGNLYSKDIDLLKTIGGNPFRTADAPTSSDFRKITVQDTIRDDHPYPSAERRKSKSIGTMGRGAHG